MVFFFGFLFFFFFFFFFFLSLSLFLSPLSLSNLFFSVVHWRRSKMFKQNNRWIACSWSIKYLRVGLNRLLFNHIPRSCSANKKNFLGTRLMISQELHGLLPDSSTIATLHPYWRLLWLLCRLWSCNCRHHRKLTRQRFWIDSLFNEYLILISFLFFSSMRIETDPLDSLSPITRLFVSGFQSD